MPVIILVRSVKSREIDGGRDHNTEAHGEKVGDRETNRRVKKRRGNMVSHREERTHKIIKKGREK